MNRIRWNPKWLALLGSLIAIAVVVVVFLIPEAQTHGQALDALNQRLNQIGVQSVSVELERRDPLELAVVFHQDDTKTSLDELWRFHLAIREVELLYLSGFPVSSYTIAIERADGDIERLGISYLYPNRLSQQLTQADPSDIGDRQTEKVIEELTRTKLERFASHDLHFASVSSSTGNEVRANTKVLIIEIAAPSRDVANEYLRELGFMGNAIAGTANHTHGAQIAILRLHVLDEKGKVVGMFLRDYETREERWWFAEGMDAPYYRPPMVDLSPLAPPPAPLESPLSPPTAPSFGSPLPTPVADKDR